MRGRTAALVARRRARTRRLALEHLPHQGTYLIERSAAHLVTACRTPQELRQFAYDPES